MKIELMAVAALIALGTTNASAQGVNLSGSYQCVLG